MPRQAQQAPRAARGGKLQVTAPTKANVILGSLHEAARSIDPAMVAAELNLTEMENQVAVRLAQGMSVREIAAAVGRKEGTIRSHVKRILAKLKISRQVDLVRVMDALARDNKGPGG